MPMVLYGLGYLKGSEGESIFKKLMHAGINGATNPIEPHHPCPQLVVCHSALKVYLPNENSSNYI